MQVSTLHTLTTATYTTPSMIRPTTSPTAAFKEEVSYRALPADDSDMTACDNELLLLHRRESFEHHYDNS